MEPRKVTRFSSHQNAPVERPHRHIGCAIRAMLSGASLAPKFWPYAFYHFLRLHNLTVHGNAKKTPYEICSGRKPILSLLRTFGCRVYFEPPRTRRPAKSEIDARTGIFLGYAQTLKNLLYYDLESHVVKTALHARYDEGMNDVADPPPNARLVRFAQRGEPFPSEATPIETIELDVSENPFQDLRTLSVLTAGEDSHLGFVFSKCSHRLRAYLSELQPRTPAAGIRNGRRQLVGAYIISVQGTPVFTVTQANLALSAAFDAAAPGDPIELVFAPESRADAVDSRRPPLHLQLSQLKWIHALRTVSGEGDTPSVSATVAALEDAYTDDDLFETIRHIRGDELDGHLVHHIRGESTADEKALTSFTRRKLKQLPTWNLWRDSEWKQLDAHQKQNVFGEPCRSPPGARYSALTGATRSSPVEPVRLACVALVRSVLHPSFASPRHMHLALISHACACSLPCPRHKVSLC
jgi:hypothetical protein